MTEETQPIEPKQALPQEPPMQEARALSPSEFEQIAKEKINKEAGEKTQKVGQIEKEIQTQEEVLAEEKTNYLKKIRKETDRLKKVDIIEMPKATYLLSELPFFKIEPYILLVVSFMGLFLTLTALVGIVDPIVNIVAFGTLTATAWGIWILKKTLYMPSKTRFPVIKIFSSGLAAVACAKIVDRKIWFNKNIAPTVITNYRAMTDMFTGYPLIVAFEGFFENLDLPGMMKGKADLNLSERLKATIDEALEQGARKERLKQKSAKRNLLNDPLAWMVGIVIIILLAYTFMVALPQADTVKTLKESSEAVEGSLTDIKQTLTVGTTPKDNVIITKGGT